VYEFQNQSQEKGKTQKERKKECQTNGTKPKNLIKQSEKNLPAQGEPDLKKKNKRKTPTKAAAGSQLRPERPQ